MRTLLRENRSQAAETPRPERPRRIRQTPARMSPGIRPQVSSIEAYLKSFQCAHQCIGRKIGEQHYFICAGILSNAKRQHKVTGGPAHAIYGKLPSVSIRSRRPPLFAPYFRRADTLRYMQCPNELPAGGRLLVRRASPSPPARRHSIHRLPLPRLPPRKNKSRRGRPLRRPPRSLGI